MTLPTVFSPAELAEVMDYHRPQYVYAAVAQVLDVVVIALLLRFGVRTFYRWGEASASALSRRTHRFQGVPVLRALPATMDTLWGGPGWGTALLFASFSFLVLNTVFLPVDFYFGHVLEHRHGLSNRDLAGYVWDSVKDWGFRLGAKAALVVGLYGLARRLLRWWAWLGAVAGAALLFAGMMDPLANRLAIEQSPLPEGPLRQHLTALMHRADAAFEDVVVERASKTTKKVGAYFAGQGPTRTIVLSDTLVAAFPDEEIEAAVAHELGHLRETSLPGRVAASLALVAFLFALDRLFRLSARRGWFGATDFADVRTLPLVSVAAYLLFAVAVPVSSAFAREREREADLYALALTGKPEAFQSMLVRVARMNKLDPSPPRWIVLLGDTHPSIVERLELAEQRKAPPPSPRAP